MPAAKITYTVAEAGFLFGDYYKPGDTIALHPEQAKYDLPPHGTMLKPLAAVPASAPARRAAPGAKSAPEGAN